MSAGVSAADAFLVLIIITDLQGILQLPHILRGQAHGSPAILYLQIHLKNTFAKKIVSQMEIFANLEILFEPKNDIIPSFKSAVWRCHWEKNNLLKKNVFLCQFHDSCGRKTGSKFLTWTMSTSPVSWQEIQLLGKIESAK